MLFCIVLYMKNNKDKSVKRGLTWLKTGWFFHNFLILTPVIVLIYTQKDITVGDFFLIQGIFRLAQFLFEIPSGYMSDCLSRKRVMIVGAAFLLSGFVALALANGFWGLVLGEGLLGIAGALFSGTLEAYTYDLLKRNKSQKQFLKEFGEVTTFGGIASFIASVSGGVLFVAVGANGVLWLEALFAVFTMISFCFLPNLTEIRRVVKRKDAIADALSITVNTLKNSKLRNLILFPALFGAFTIVLLWISQPIMETGHISVALFGVYSAITQLSFIFFSKYAYKICEKLGEIRTSVVTILAVIMGAVLGLLATNVQNMFIVYIACAVMAVVPAIRVLNNLQYNTLIHHSIKSNERGTVLSTRAMVSTALGAASLIIAKFLMDGYGITTTLVCVLGATVLLVWSLIRVEKHIK